MRKLLYGVGASALVAAPLVLFVGPAQASHGPEGTVTIAGVELCSEEDPNPGDGQCTWTAENPNGYVGSGPFTVDWVEPDGTVGSVSCASGEFCDSTGQDVDPIPSGSVVTSNGSGGGTFAAGDEDTTDGQ